MKLCKTSHAWAMNQPRHSKFKTLDQGHYYEASSLLDLRENSNNFIIKMHLIGTNDRIADIFTQNLDKTRFFLHLKCWSVFSNISLAVSALQSQFSIETLPISIVLKRSNKSCAMIKQWPLLMHKQFLSFHLTLARIKVKAKKSGKQHFLVCPSWIHSS